MVCLGEEVTTAQDKTATATEAREQHFFFQRLPRYYPVSTPLLPHTIPSLSRHSMPFSHPDPITIPGSSHHDSTTIPLLSHDYISHQSVPNLFTLHFVTFHSSPFTFPPLLPSGSD